MDIHLREFDKAERQIRVLYHIPVPGAGVNTAGVSWRDVVAQRNPDVVGVDTAHTTLQQQGALIERSATLTFTSHDLSKAQRLAELKAHYQATKATVVAELQVELMFYGHEMSGE